MIGGGVSGLVCANHLKALGLQPTVYDTGKRGVGGRMSSRTVQIEDSTYVMDHSTQFFTATDPVFADMVAEWKNGMYLYVFNIHDLYVCLLVWWLSGRMVCTVT